MIYSIFFYNLRTLIYKMLFLICFDVIMITLNNSQANLNDMPIGNRSKDTLISVSDDIQRLPTLSHQVKIRDEIMTIISLKNSPLIFTASPARSSQSLYVTDVADYLKNIAGFTAIRNGGVNNEPVFRGMFGSRIRILMDNGEILGACFSHMDPISAYISPETFDILNVIKGPQTVLWGPVASGATLQFERYHPCFDESKIKLRSNVMIGSNNKIDKNIDSIIGSKYGYLRLIGNISQSDDYYDGHKHRVYSAWYKWNADAILSLNVSEDTHLEISLGQGNGNAKYAVRSMDGLCFARESYGMKVETTDMIKKLDKIEFQAWHNYVSHTMADTLPSVIRLSFKKCCGFSNDIENNVDRLIWGVRGIATTQWDNIKCYSGVDMQVNKHREHVKSRFNWDKDIVSQDIGIFTELIANSLSSKRFVGGTRLEYSVVNFNNFSKYKRYSIIYPAGFVRYEDNVNPLLSYYVGVGTSFRFPDYWELFSSRFSQNINSSIENVLELKPEKVVQIDIGANFQHLQTSGWISSYAGYVKDFILCSYYNDHISYDGGINHTENINAKICGTEVGLNYQFNDYWRTESNVSWSWGANVDNNCSLPKIPPLEGRVICQWIKGCCSVTAVWRFVFPQSNNLFLSPASVTSKNMLLHTRENYNTSGFGTLSTHLAWTNSRFYKLSIGVDNLLNHHYREYFNLYIHKRFGYPTGTLMYEPGRIWWVKLGIAL
ncbi:TonB-dependent receptor domain-containing protein [Blochmannia endosymbiont of Camponotus sp.]|uniref:TonB-dependent receptor domain-containing protein n=1 Tax=Blochmannia endosymbiont of Camponotus sp. TaxID=700220 RepID=UPI0020248349|nr:TonB-dependent receptor [Blochmannia endosymbiont of Camponotus sp.]URJ31106.1 TonB-dependent receptor [Blochmannia endosymbiont of Camponotus sp.]